MREALAAGLPVIASAVGGIEELAATEGSRLQLVPPDDPGALADAPGSLHFAKRACNRRPDSRTPAEAYRRTQVRNMFRSPGGKCVRNAPMTRNAASRATATARNRGVARRGQLGTTYAVASLRPSVAR